MTIITIPRSREDMISRLTGIQRLLTATQWEKAAILAAFVTLPGQGHRSDLGENPQVLSPHQFAALRIAGCKDPKVVRSYVRRWIATTRPIPKPGDEIDLDGLPDWDTETANAIAKAVAENPEAVAKALVESNRGPSAIKKARKEYLDKAERDYQQEVLERNVHAREADALRDHHEARQHLVEPLWKAKVEIDFVHSEWSDYLHRLTPGDIEGGTGIITAIQEIENSLAIVKMLATHDIVGEVLRHDQA